MRDDLFIPGYLDTMVKSGKRPTYGYPKTKLPKVPPGHTMKVVNSFLIKKDETNASNKPQ